MIRFSEGAVLTPSGGSITPTDAFHHVAAGTISAIATTNFDTNAISFLLLEADGAVTLTPGASLKVKTTSLVDDDLLLLKLEGTIWSEVGTTADVTLTGTQTLTNKTLTSPTINSPTITSPTISSGQLTSSSQYRAKAYNAGAFSVPDAELTAVTLDTEAFDVGSLHDTGTNTTRMTVPTGGAGVWIITGQVSFASNATGIRLAAIRKNGTTYIGLERRTTINGDQTDVQVFAIDTAADAAYYELIAYQTSGGALNATGSIAGTWLAAVRLF